MEPRARGNTAVAVALGGLIALAVAMGVGRFAFTPLLPMMQEDAGLSTAAAGWLASANYIGYFIGALAAIRVQVAATTAIRIGLLSIALATAAMGFTHSFAAWIALRAIAGLGSAWILIFVSAWSLERLAPLGRPLLSGVVFAGVGTGIAAAGVLCVALMRSGASSAQAWLALGLFSMLASVAVWGIFRRGEGATPAAALSKPSAKTALRWDADTVRLVVCYGVFGFGYIIPATFLPAMARQLVHDPAVFGWAWPIFGLAAAASTVAAAAFARRLGNGRLWILSHIAMAVGVALPVLVPGIVAIMAAALLVGGTFMITTMVAISEAREVAAAHAKALIAAMTSAFAIGQILGPLAAALAIRIAGSFSAALLFASALLGVTAYVLSRRYPRYLLT